MGLLGFVTQFCVTWELPSNTCQNKCIYKHSINPEYIKQLIITSTRIYDWELLVITVHEVI